MAFLPTTQRNTEMLLIKVAQLLEQLQTTLVDGFYEPPTSADADAPLNSIYYSTDSSKLAYKDSRGTTHDLY